MFTSGLALASYALLAWGLYTIAQRRGINKPWLAWIPVANLWILGCVSDQYRQVALGQVKVKRKAILSLSILTIALAVALAVIAVIWIIGLIGHSDLSALTSVEWTKLSEMTVGEIAELFTAWGKSIAEGGTDYLQSTLWMPMVMVVLAVVLGGLAIALMVLEYMAYADVFASSDPATAKLFTFLGIVLSLVGAGIVLSLFVFMNKDKDFGMTPKASADQPAVDATPEM